MHVVHAHFGSNRGQTKPLEESGFDNLGRLAQPRWNGWSGRLVSPRAISARIASTSPSMATEDAVSSRENSAYNRLASQVVEGY